VTKRGGGASSDSKDRHEKAYIRTPQLGGSGESENIVELMYENDKRGE